jgi:hypothetical protein
LLGNINSEAVVSYDGFGFGDKAGYYAAHQHKDEDGNVDLVVSAASSSDFPVLDSRNNDADDSGEGYSIEYADVSALPFEVVRT